MDQRNRNRKYVYKEKDLNSDLTDNERLGTIGEELVEEGHESARENADGPHAEGPDGLRRVIGCEHREAHLLHRRVFVFIELLPFGASLRVDFHGCFSHREILVRARKGSGGLI